MDEAEADDLDEHLDAVLIGGREVREVRIVDYSHNWPRRFEAERNQIEAALGPTACRVEHIGSTAVPGLAAKPVVDILLAVEDPDDESTYVPQLTAAGYVLRVREPGHRMLRTPERDVHLHVWRTGGDDERRDLVFRDRLRACAEDRAEYERVKRDLAGMWSDMNYYARAKTTVIEAILQRAAEADPQHGRRT
jgi:GrpB-like predicted nucleotidyltransferase (UPF0157 family)